MKCMSFPYTKLVIFRELSSWIFDKYFQKYFNLNTKKYSTLSDFPGEPTPVQPHPSIISLITLIKIIFFRYDLPFNVYIGCESLLGQPCQPSPRRCENWWHLGHPSKHCDSRAQFPFYVPNLVISEQTSLHNIAHVPIVSAPMMYFIGASLFSSSSRKWQSSVSNSYLALCKARQQAWWGFSLTPYSNYVLCSAPPLSTPDVFTFPLVSLAHSPFTPSPFCHSKSR